MEGMILFTALGGELLVRYRLRFTRGRHRAPRRLPRPSDRPRRAREQLAPRRRDRIGHRVRDAAPLRRARRAARGALRRAQPRSRGDDAGRRRDGLLGRAERSAVRAGTALFLAVLVAALAGAAMALLFAFLVITLRANQIVSGLALTIFAGAAGLSSYLGNDLGLADSPADAPVRRPSTRSASPTSPSSARSCSGRRGSSTRRGRSSRSSPSTSRARGPGLNVRAVGESPQTADAMGISVTALPLPARPRGRRARRRRRCLLQPRADAAVGRRPHRRRGLDRDRARHLRLLAARALPGRRLLLRRASRRSRSPCRHAG